MTTDTQTDAYTLKRRFTVIASDAQGAANVKRVIEQLDPKANVLRIGHRIDFWTTVEEITTRTFRTMSCVTYAMVTDTKKEEQIVRQNGNI